MLMEFVDQLYVPWCFNHCSHAVTEWHKCLYETLPVWHIQSATGSSAFLLLHAHTKPLSLTCNAGV